MATLGCGMEIEPRGRVCPPEVNSEACTVTFQPAPVPRESVTVNVPMVAVVVRAAPFRVMPAKSPTLGMVTC